MPLIDMHSHWGTERGWTGSPLKRPEDMEALKEYFRWNPDWVSEGEMAEYFRESGVRVVLDLAYEASLPIEIARELHDYAFETQRQHPDVILGNWIRVNPADSDHIEELQRCIEQRQGFLGMGSGLVAVLSDPIWDRCYRICAEANIPVLMTVGMVALGAGVRGGLGLVLEDWHPRHIDLVAARYPELTILAGHAAWPWQADMNAILLHKGNVWCELHGWSPKYHPPELKYELQRRLKDKIMFGADYPMLRYERLIREWHEEGYDEAILEKIFYKNAQVFLSQLGIDA